MPDLFGLDIAGIINDGIADAGGVLDVSLIKVTHGDRGSNSTGGEARIESAPIACKGFINNKTSMRKGDSLTTEENNSVLILGASLPAGTIPELNDKITVEGSTFQIIKTPKRDPAAATYICWVS